MRLASYVPGELIPLPLSGSIPELPHVAKVGCDYDVIRPFRLGRRDLVPRHRRSLRNFYATQSQSLSGWRSRNQQCEPSQILGDSGQNELILGASWASQTKPTELQDALQVREPHLDLLALTA